MNVNSLELSKEMLECANGGYGYNEKMLNELYNELSQISNGVIKDCINILCRNIRVYQDMLFTKNM